MGAGTEVTPGPRLSPSSGPGPSLSPGPGPGNVGLVPYSKCGLVLVPAHAAVKRKAGLRAD